MGSQMDNIFYFKRQLLSRRTRRLCWAEAAQVWQYATVVASW